MNGPMRSLLLIALAATLGLVLSDAPSYGDLNTAEVAQAKIKVVAPGAAKSITSPETVTVGEGLVDEFAKARQGRQSRKKGESDGINLFAAKSWYVPPPPPPPPKPLPPPPPTAPPLPFSFMGQYREPEGKVVIFLVKGDRLYLTSPGELLDGIYRVEGIQSGQLGLTYLPLNIRQTMSVGEAS